MKNSNLKSVLRAGTALLAVVAAGLLTTPAQAVVINDNYTPSDVVDTTNVTGVGQMVVDLQNGFIGLCTATLINPRTVIFASHCVNEAPDGSGFEPGSGYGAAFGGLPIGFFFNANNNQAGNSAIGHWLNGGYHTRTSDNAYNANYVVYNPHATELGLGGNFLQADVAMAALDTPAVGIPTWTLLFSPLDGPTHATIEGYGVHGTASTGGTQGIDFRRRVAENTISMLGSLDDLEGFLFGFQEGLPQNLYWLDFNDPKFGTADASVYDFNIFHDAATQKEAITAPGDSGGPLVVDQAFANNQKVIAAVLSGGFSQFFNGQPVDGYGTASFYQPLYLFWDWIVANNPYKYVSAKAGNGMWTDPTHWVMNLDPNYVVASGNNTVNALPDTPAQGIPSGSNVNSPKFGVVCYFDTCMDVNTGQLVSTHATSGNASGTVQSGPAVVPISDILGSNGGASQAAQGITGTHPTPADSVTPAEGSAPVNGVMIQGAPGSSDFVPNDTDGDPVSGAPARYYDVTLNAAGTTTLDNAAIVIDRLTINGPTTGLTITDSGWLGTLIDTTMYAGQFQVDGTYSSVGDFALLGGVLTGHGTVNTPYLTAVLGAIAPGTVGTTGTLTVNGDVIFSSASGFLADVAQNSRDLLDVYGTVSLDGTLVVTPVSGYVPRYHDQKSVLFADTITGSFANVPDYIPGILFPTVSTVTVGTGPTAYQSEVVTFEAGSYAGLPGLTDDQKATATLLDNGRVNYAGLSTLYDAIDPTTDGTTLAALENLAPDAARILPQVTQLLNDAYSNSLWSYIGGMSHTGDGQIAIQTSTLKLVENSQVGSYEMRSMLTNLGSKDSGPLTMAAPKAAEGGGMALPKGWGGFLNGQAIDGSVTVGGSGGKADVNGWLVSLGIDMPATQHFRVGLSLAIGEAEAKLRMQPAMTNTSMKQGVIYGQWDSNVGVFVNGFAGASIESISTEHIVVVGASAFGVKGHTDGTSAMFGLQVGTVVDDVLGGQVKPAVGLQFARPDVDGYTETGSAAAMTVLPFSKEELDLRIGFDASWKLDVASTVVRPDLHLFLVNAASNSSGGVQTMLAASPGTPVTFSIPTDSSTWAEVGLGAQIDLCDYATLGFHFNANPGRGDATYAAYSGSLRVNF